jgi:two-component system, NtrC family, sensor kinase
MASLFVVRGRDQGKHFPLASRPMRIGRESTSEIRLLDSEASRSHAEIRASANGGYTLIDLGSSNGTIVNGRPVTQHPLASGDRIEIGGTLLIFTGSGSQESHAAAHGVDIVAQSRAAEASRIVSSIAGSPSARVKSSPGDADRSLEVMYLTALAVGRTDDIPELLNRILRLVFDWVEGDRGCIMLRDNETQRLRPAARCDRSPGDAAQSSREPGRIAISRTILDYVIERKEGVRTSDAMGDNRFDSAQSIVQSGVREALCVPLQGRYGIVGALYVDTYTSSGSIIQSGYRERFNDEHLRLMTAIGHQAALAIEDTFYYSAMMQSERLAVMGQTIATLSHHIKNILQGIRGGSYLIDAGLKRNDTDAVRRGWAMVDRNQERISNLVMDMLTFSKEREPEKIDADLNETVDDVVELMITRAEEMGVQLERVMPANMPPANFDPEALHRAILNIVTNAIDAAAQRVRDEDDCDDEHTDSASEQLLVKESLPAKRPAKVIVDTLYDALGGWTIRVTDNGSGISPDDREKIFSLFESSKGARGTGLGLPVSEKILREHGGYISIDDAADPPGACFALHLPLPTTDNPTAENSPASNPSSDDSSGDDPATLMHEPI